MLSHDLSIVITDWGMSAHFPPILEQDVLTQDLIIMPPDNKYVPWSQCDPGSDKFITLVPAHEISSAITWPLKMD